MEARSFKDSFSYAWSGIKHTWSTQRNFRLHVFTGATILALSFALKISHVELLFVGSAVFAVLVMELINTALETAVDLSTEEFHPLAYIAKNVGAAAVLMAALYALLVAVMVFGRRIVNYF